MSAQLSTKVCSYVLSTFCGVHQLQLIFRTSLLDTHENLRLLITQQVSKLISPLLASTVSLASLSSLGKSPFGDA
ncbi:hypothetical protein E4T17_18570 [Vibrio vulnificus]|nr:hypothetical protein [Vibrio vulnificus]